MYNQIFVLNKQVEHNWMVNRFMGLQQKILKKYNNMIKTKKFFVDKITRIESAFCSGPFILFGFLI